MATAVFNAVLLLWSFVQLRVCGGFVFLRSRIALVVLVLDDGEQFGGKLQGRF